MYIRSLRVFINPFNGNLDAIKGIEKKLRPALTVAIEQKNTTSVKMLLMMPNGKYENMLLKAIQSKNTKIIKLLINNSTVRKDLHTKKIVKLCMKLPQDNYIIMQLLLRQREFKIPNRHLAELCYWIININNKNLMLVLLTGLKRNPIQSLSQKTYRKIFDWAISNTHDDVITILNQHLSMSYFLSYLDLSNIESTIRIAILCKCETQLYIKLIKKHGYIILNHYNVLYKFNNIEPLVVIAALRDINYIHFLKILAIHSSVKLLTIFRNILEYDQIYILNHDLLIPGNIRTSWTYGNENKIILKKYLLYLLWLISNIYIPKDELSNIIAYYCMINK